ncbi:LOW QUALITY PROTEIN: homeobox protein vent1-like [Xiphophorus couchianus]|uniref:LOW QUALITY PROTEIN: homeobox protein vent1-like n=1 Tax=Xiphophorus couchianus TaxID=32473 RepID=UPI001016AFBB|nr:LOW QUALITY PROTEIN: homeobox protein vent1-like [Xiphophorus couchianus]
MQMAASVRGSYKSLAAGGSCHSTLSCDIWWIYRPLGSSTVDMVKYFSVDWLAQSHNSGAAKEGQRASRAHRPHVLCMVQPSAPAFGKGYLQPKPKSSKAAKQGGSDEVREPQSSGVGSPLHPADCSSPIFEMSGYSSGYESEAASSECPSADGGNDAEKDAPQRRVRTKFTPEQISRLEKIFSKHKYLDAGERLKTAQKLNLTETQVRTWFQNRRMKLKREVQDYLAPQVSFQPLHPVQYHSMAAHQAHYSASGRGLYPLPVSQLVLAQQLTPHPAPQLMIRHPHFY